MIVFICSGSICGLRIAPDAEWRPRAVSANLAVKLRRPFYVCAKLPASLAESGSYAPRPCPLSRKRLARSALRRSRIRNSGARLAWMAVRCAMTVHQTDAALEFLPAAGAGISDGPGCALCFHPRIFGPVHFPFARKLPGALHPSYQAREAIG